MARIIKYKNYITKSGDTWDLLALGMYYDERKTHEIIEFNPEYAHYLVLPPGLTLRLPILEETYDGETLPPWRRVDGGDESTTEVTY